MHKRFILTLATVCTVSCGSVLQSMASLIASAPGTAMTATAASLATGMGGRMPGMLGRKKVPAQLANSCAPPCAQVPACPQTACGQCNGGCTANTNANMRPSDLCALPQANTAGSKASALSNRISNASNSSSNSAASSSKNSASNSSSSSNSKTQSSFTVSDTSGNTWTASKSGAQLAIIAPLSSQDSSSSDSDSSEWEYFYEYVSQ